MSDISPSFVDKVPDGDNRTRRVCEHCAFVDYQNPKIVAGAVCVANGKILLCKRTIEPRRGYWTIPAGFMELGESVEAAAKREAAEEACAQIELQGLIGVYSVPRIGQVHMMFRALLRDTPRPGDETEAVEMVAYEDIQWDSLAFPTVRWALEDWRGGINEEPVTPKLRSDPPPWEAA